jgi:hypothetical protein
MMTVVSLPNSFIRFNEPETVANFRREVQIAYPAFNADDFNFNFKITGDGLDIPGLVLDPTQIRLGFTVNKTSLSRDWFAVYGLAPVVLELSPTEALLAWPHGMPGLTSSIMPHECFYIGITNPTFPPGSQWLGTSNLFKRVVTNKLTVVIEYWSDGEAFGFPYCEVEPFHNKARVPAYIGNPQFTSKEDVYRKSNGELVSLNAIVGKQYQMKTAFLPEEIHWPINVAFNHENIRVTDDRYDMYVKKNGQYDVNWPSDFEPILAPALVKLDQSLVPDSSGAGCGCIEFVNCEDVDFVAMEAGTGNTHQIDVVSSCAPDEIIYLITYARYPGGTSVSSSGFVSIVPPVGTYEPVLVLLATIQLTCGAVSCNINFYSIVF